MNKICTFSLSLKSVREFLIFILSGFRQVIFKKPEDFIRISCIFSNGVMEINLQVTVKAFMPSVCHDYNYSPAAQHYSLKWNWKVHTEVLSDKVRPHHTKPCLTFRHIHSQVSAIRITALYRFITEELCACSYPAANAKEIMKALNYPHDFCVAISQEHLMSTTPGFADGSNSLSTAVPVFTSIHTVLLQVLERVVKESVIAVGKGK